MPYKKYENTRNVLPKGSLALTLIGSTDWTKKDKHIQKLHKTNAHLHNGILYACLERYGGNSFERKN